MGLDFDFFSIVDFFYVVIWKKKSISEFSVFKRKKKFFNLKNNKFLIFLVDILYFF